MGQFETEEQAARAFDREARRHGRATNFKDIPPGEEELYASEEGDAVDPVSRTRAMNGAVDDLNVLMDAESEVLGQAFELLEKMGIKGLEKPPGREERDAVDEDA